MVAVQRGWAIGWAWAAVMAAAMTCFVGRAQAPVLISEFLADNHTTFLDSDGDASPWIELVNLGEEAVNLEGWSLTDDPANPMRWRFPAYTVQSYGQAVIFASGKNRFSNSQLHTSFTLAKQGGYLALFRPDGELAHAYAPGYPAQLVNLSYGVSWQPEYMDLVVQDSVAAWTVPEKTLPTGWNLPEFDEAAWAHDPMGLGYGTVSGGFYRTDIGAALRDVGSSVLVRLNFVIPEEEMPDLDTLRLDISYDEGVVAYLNGTEVFRRNAPDELDGASTATVSGDPWGSNERVDLTLFRNLLREGTNVLAFHGLNASRADENFLLQASLRGLKYRVSEPHYLAQPTPRAANAPAIEGFVADTKFSVDRGIFTAPFTVAITTETSGATIRYTTNGTTPTATQGLVYTNPVPISRTTVLRAVAVKPGFRPSNVDTHTYLFLADMTGQSAASATSRGFPASWGVRADYAMDPRVVGADPGPLLESLRALPSLCLSTDITNLFGSKGIYQNATASGAAWERAVSLELIGTNGVGELQENCGLRIQGGAFRSFGFTEKKSFRLLFKQLYGAGKLRHRLFPETDAATEFDTLVLRAGANDSYGWSDAGSTVQFIRDEFGRSLQRAMGHPAPHGRFVHLYLNGLYWGLYNLVERPNEDFSPAYFGGEPEEWDANNAGQFKNGGQAAQTRWSQFLSAASTAKPAANWQAYLALQGRAPDGSVDTNLPPWLDVANYIDYMVVNMWGGNWDWPFKNYWYGYHPGRVSPGYKFYLWDFENTMGNNRERSPLNMVSPWDPNTGVGVPHYRLQSNREYQIDFADRVHRWFFNGGVLTPASLIQRYRRLADSVEPAILAESARWGDDNFSTPLGLKEWRAERDWILTTYLPQRSAIVMNQFLAKKLYPAGVGAPEFSRFGGVVAAGTLVTMSHTNATGLIYYTLDGTDPRDPGGAMVGLQSLAYSEPTPVLPPVVIRARVLLDDGTWSPLTEATFSLPQDLSALKLNELMYHPPDEGITDGDEFEFLELFNNGSVPLDLSGAGFATGIGFTFTNGFTLPARATIVLARNPEALGRRYPGVAVAGVYTGKLDNAGELLTLTNVLGEMVFSVNYDDNLPWPVAADGGGSSLNRVTLEGADGDPANWSANLPTPGSGPFREATEVTWLPPALEGDSVVLQFRAQAGATYSVLRRLTADGSWLKLTDVLASPADQTVRVAHPMNDAPAQFFRVVSPAAP